MTSEDRKFFNTKFKEGREHFEGKLEEQRKYFVKRFDLLDKRFDKEVSQIHTIKIGRIETGYKYKDR